LISFHLIEIVGWAKCIWSN